MDVLNLTFIPGLVLNPEFYLRTRCTHLVQSLMFISKNVLTTDVSFKIAWSVQACSSMNCRTDH